MRMRLMVVGENPRCGRTKGVAISAAAVNASTTKGRFGFMRGPRSLAARRAKEPVGAEHQHERHRDEQHDVGVAGIEHRRDANDLAGDEAAKNRAWERTNAADDDDDKSLNKDRFADIGRNRDDGSVYDTGEARRHGADAEDQHED